MKNQYAVFVHDEQFTCEEMFDTDRGDGIQIYYDEVKPRVLVTEMFGIGFPDDDDAEEGQKFEETVRAWIIAEVQFPVEVVRTAQVVPTYKAPMEIDTTNFTDFSKRNLAVIENFILHFTHGEEPLSSQMLQSAKEYIAEDHADGEDSEEAELEREAMEEFNLVKEAYLVVKHNEELRAEYVKQFGWNEPYLDAVFYNTRNLTAIKPKAVKLLLKLAQK